MRGGADELADCLHGQIGDDFARHIARFQQAAQDLLPTEVSRLVQIRHSARAAGGQSVEQLPDKDDPVFLRDIADPFPDRAADPAADGVVRLADGKLPVVNAPGGQTVLQDAGDCGADDAGVGDGRLEQLADDGEGGNNAAAAAVNALDGAHVRDLRTEAGAVQQIKALHLLQHRVRQIASGKEGEVRTFRVSAEEPAATGPQMLIRVAERQLLRFGTGKADHEILFPPGKGVVRPAEAHEREAALVVKAHGRKLQRRVLPDLIHVIADHKLAEAAGGDGLGNDLLVVEAGARDQDPRGTLVDHLPAIAQPERLRPLLPDGLEIKIGQQAQHEGVRVPQTVMYNTSRQGKQAAPASRTGRQGRTGTVTSF